MFTLSAFSFRITFICLLTALLVSCKKDEMAEEFGKITLKFTHEVDGQDLVLADQEFTNAAGNKYRVEKLKYYISKITFTRADGSGFTLPNGYYLIEQTNLEKREEIELTNIPAGNYSSISFAIGVDSARNFSTEMVGELNPNNDMAWNWVSGYKFLLMEGKFTTQTNATDALVLHIGGNRSYRTISINTLQNNLFVGSSKNTQVELTADVNQIFDAQQIINLNETNAIIQPGEQADKIANNYASGMFRLKNISIQ
jgi:hypothetical protein